MKKIMALILITSLMVLSFVSCEGDIFQSISSFMGQTGENMLISGGVIVPSTENVEALNATLDSVGESTTSEDVADDLRDSIESMLTSESETASSSELLSDPVEPADLPDTLETELRGTLEADLGLTLEELIDDEADLAVAILLTDLMKKADAAGETPTEAQEEEIANDAKVVLEFVKKSTSIGNLDVTGAIGDLLAGMTRSSSRTTGVDDPVEGSSLDEMIDMVGPMFEMYFNETDTNSDGSISTEEFTAIKSDYMKIRRVYERGAQAIKNTDQPMKLSDVVFYISSILVTENDNLLPVDPDTINAANTNTIDYPSMIDLFNKIHTYITDGPDGIDLSFWDDDAFNDDTGLYDEVNGLSYAERMMNAIYAAILEPETVGGKTEFEKTLIAISSAVPDNAFFTDAIQDFIDTMKPAPAVD